MICFIISIIILTTVLGFYNLDLKHRLLLHPYAVIKRQQYYRLLTAGLIHVSWIHLLFNVIVIYVVGSEVEKKYVLESFHGHVEIIGLFFCCIAGGNLLSTILNRSNFSFTSCGASPGALGLFICLLLHDPHGVLIQLPVIRVQNFEWMIYFIVVFTINFAVKRLKQIDNAAHLGGVMAAFLFTYLLMLP